VKWVISFLHDVIFLSLVKTWKLIQQLYPISDDMDIAPDFFDYFEAAATLLDKDKYVLNKGRMLNLFSSVLLR